MPKVPEYEQEPPTDLTTDGNISEDSDESPGKIEQARIKPGLADYMADESGIIVDMVDSPPKQERVVELRNLNLQPQMGKRERKVADAAYKMPVKEHSPYKQVTNRDSAQTPYDAIRGLARSRRAESAQISFNQRFGRSSA